MDARGVASDRKRDRRVPSSVIQSGSMLWGRFGYSFEWCGGFAAQPPPPPVAAGEALLHEIEIRDRKRS